MAPGASGSQPRPLEVSLGRGAFSEVVNRGPRSRNFLVKGCIFIIIISSVITALKDNHVKILKNTCTLGRHTCQLHNGANFGKGSTSARAYKWHRVGRGLSPREGPRLWPLAPPQGHRHPL